MPDRLWESRISPGKVLLRKFADAAKNNALADNTTRYNPVYYRRAATAIQRARTSAEQANRVADALLQRTLSWARQTSYGAQFGCDLAEWPILSKRDVAARPADFRRGRFALPAATGGSTGIPLLVWRSLECAAAEQAFLDALLADAGRAMLEKKIAVLRADHVKDPADPHPPFGVWRNRGRRLVLSSVHLSPATLTWFVETLKSFQPDVLWVYPSALSQLLRLMEQARATLSVPTVLSSSEMLSRGLFVHAGERLQARVVDYYGQAERVCMASCNPLREFRFEPAYGRVELLPEPPTTAAAPATARIVATGYWNSAFPLVRYDTGDRIVLPGSAERQELEEIANGRKAFPEIIGRADDYLCGRDGERITGINHIPRDLKAVLKIQVVQESETRIRTLVLPHGQLSALDRATIERNARALLPSYMALEIEAVDQLDTLPNGKTPFIIRRTQS